MKSKSILAAAVWAVGVLVAGLPAPQTQAKDATVAITVRAGKPDSPNYLLARQFSEALVLAGNGYFTLDVKESQGSVQNVIDAPKGVANTLFTASHSVIAQAHRGARPFEPNPAYNDIRSLFPIPFQTVHWLVRQDSGITALADLAGHSFIPGNKGSVSERLTGTILQILGIDRKIQLIDIDVASAPTAVMNNKVSGLAVAGFYPLPIVNEIGKATPIRLLGLTPPELAKMLGADDSIAQQVIPKGTYPSVDYDVSTIAVQAGVYTTRKMSADTAYALTKGFWSQLAPLKQRNPAWNATSPATIPALGIKLHPGALRYYDEAGISVPAGMR